MWVGVRNAGWSEGDINGESDDDTEDNVIIVVVSITIIPYSTGVT